MDETPRKFRVLVVDDSPTVRRGIIFALRRSGMVRECVEAADGREALDIIDRDSDLDLVLCDVVMPHLDGFEVVKSVRSKVHLVDLPVILLTGEEAIGQKVRGLSIGASDYVTKPFNSQELLARVKVQLRLKALQDELRQLSITDPLTQLYNRRYFLVELERELGRSRHLGLQMGFAIADIDHFKGINDRHGHLVGDRTLVEFATYMREHCRPVDRIARYGGEEFVILMPHTDKQVCLTLMESLRQGIEEHDFPDLPEGLTASFGLCTYPFEGVESVDDLIQHADEALYRAKEAGRNKLIVAA